MIHLSVKQSVTDHPKDRPQRWRMTLATGNHRIAMVTENEVNKSDLVSLAESIADPEQGVVLHIDGEEDRTLR